MNRSKVTALARVQRLDVDLRMRVGVDQNDAQTLAHAHVHTSKSVFFEGESYCFAGLPRASMVNVLWSRRHLIK